MLDLNEEQGLFRRGYKLVAGIDEAGRGPLAGPVVAACVIIKAGFVLDRIKELKIKNKNLFLIRDSKKLSEKKREELFDVITEEFAEVGVGVCDHETIDRINILEATFLAMKKAIGALKQKPDFILVDGRAKIPNSSYSQKAIIRGDELIFSIAAASIIAKVTRDRIMKKMDSLYPDYAFCKHKGYGTELHLERLRRFGPSPIHRRSFGPVKLLMNK